MKTDFIAPSSHRIFVEKASLEHTQSTRFCYWIPSPYGMDMRIFSVLKLIEMYNEMAEVRRFDGGIDALFKYQRAYAGDQPDNEGIFVPMTEVKTIGKQPREVARELNQLTKQT